MTLFHVAATHARITRRRVWLWFAIVSLTALGALLAFISPGAPHTGGTPDLAFTGQVIALFCGAAYAAAFTDFFASASRRSMDEIEASTPAAPLTRHAALVLGTLGIVLVPSAVVLMGTGLAQTVAGHGTAVLAAIAVLVTIVLPSALVATCLSALLGAVLPHGAARVVAVLLWFGAVFSTPLVPLPTLNGTVLNLVGDTVAAGFFGASPLYPRYDSTGPLGLDATTPPAAVLSLVWQAVLIMLLLAAGSSLARARARS
ncbi:murein hydrolase transporter LrgB [Propionibacterium australiense]|uniref:Murein hydrolase transporter LrgB n=1 Tax=Propionibacterium australiense TaxID=119981 RepID=A0A383S8J2_9ACTN|nr:murein hydrolase transporter LrgB [Propionibacterium australiense]RLP07671.1 murein hydrolase transporter LrgB [Propionibacterium australiense]RLP08098.1 murein hydrolase transporter LrgB [Propionibacterium australiense]SYZ33699.1 Hypothetical protein PROPAUS_1619 [Propionibacterium australiense]VEH92885.1 Uncharacterised protein [Propionibacterium australiense]